MRRRTTSNHHTHHHITLLGHALTTYGLFFYPISNTNKDTITMMPYMSTVTAAEICKRFEVDFDPNSEYETFLCHLPNNEMLWIVPTVRDDEYMLLTEI